ncbi:MAG: hypothetical protein IMZ67_03180 [Acidobacteria bacterium]|nr:hypothetical protein [Acidobacteriota bacterium]MBE3132644.1 hypothetical protein [Acidobacteriota bacterium]
MRTTTAEQPPTSSLVFLFLGAWAVPGAAHLWQRQWTKGIVFLVALPLMFAIGIALGGRLFPFRLSEPLVALAAIADLGIGLPYFLARASSYGGGRVTDVTFEYANTFLIVAGLLNLLVVLDAYDIARGRKPTGAGQVSSAARG